MRKKGCGTRYARSGSADVCETFSPYKPDESLFERWEIEMQETATGKSSFYDVNCTLTHRNNNTCTVLLLADFEEYRSRRALALAVTI